MIGMYTTRFPKMGHAVALCLIELQTIFGQLCHKQIKEACIGYDVITEYINTPRLQIRGTTSPYDRFA
jgi:hypothetical protein